MLSKAQIIHEVTMGRIKIFPPPCADQYQPSSIDLTLSRWFMKYDKAQLYFIDPREDFHQIEKTFEVDSYLLKPGKFILGNTVERIELPNNIVGRLEGRSSWGRLGIICHATAGYIDPGFKGTLTLEISNLGTLPVLLYPGMKFCQLTFTRLEGEVEEGYTGKYMDQEMPMGSRIYLD